MVNSKGLRKRSSWVSSGFKLKIDPQNSSITTFTLCSVDTPYSNHSNRRPLSGFVLTSRLPQEGGPLIETMTGDPLFSTAGIDEYPRENLSPLPQYSFIHKAARQTQADLHLRLSHLSPDPRRRRMSSPKANRTTTQRSSHPTAATQPTVPPTSEASQLCRHYRRATRPDPQSRLWPLLPPPAQHHAISVMHRAGYLFQYRHRRRLLHRNQAAARMPGCRSCFRFPRQAALPGRIRHHHARRIASRLTCLSSRGVGCGTGMGGRTCVCS